MATSDRLPNHPTEIFTGEHFREFRGLTAIHEIVPRDILLYFTAICLYIEGTVKHKFPAKNQF